MLPRFIASEPAPEATMPLEPSARVVTVPKFSAVEAPVANMP